jgi:hypothetical protein
MVTLDWGQQLHRQSVNSIMNTKRNLEDCSKDHECKKERNGGE